MDDKVLLDYDKDLEELERQREKLQLALQMMGQEWEESGAGIGWLGNLDLPVIDEIPIVDKEEKTAEDGPIDNTILSTINTTKVPTSIPLFQNILSPNTGPSPEYLQSLLHVNESLLAQSLANTTTSTGSNNDVNKPTPLLTPIEESNDILPNNGINSPLTPIGNNSKPNNNDNDTPQDQNNDYLIHRQSESIISPLTTPKNKKKLILSSSTAITHNHPHVQY